MAQNLQDLHIAKFGSESSNLIARANLGTVQLPLFYSMTT